MAQDSPTSEVARRATQHRRRDADAAARALSGAPRGAGRLGVARRRAEVASRAVMPRRSAREAGALFSGPGAPPPAAPPPGAAPPGAPPSSPAPPASSAPVSRRHGLFLDADAGCPLCARRSRGAQRGVGFARTSCQFLAATWVVLTVGETLWPA